ncbi:hypothetical protein FRB99_005147 [Tulasnella sp. 403]|nr:hypothetical protein FRB99_005147 [Tulasnella sp. 403]
MARKRSASHLDISRESKRRRRNRRSSDEVFEEITNSLEAASAATLVEAVASTCESFALEDEDIIMGSPDSLPGPPGVEDFEDEEAPQWLFGNDGDITPEVQRLIQELFDIGTPVCESESDEPAEYDFPVVRPNHSLYMLDMKCNEFDMADRK